MTFVHPIRLDRAERRDAEAPPLHRSREATADDIEFAIDGRLADLVGALALPAFDMKRRDVVQLSVIGGSIGNIRGLSRATETAFSDPRPLPQPSTIRPSWPRCCRPWRGSSRRSMTHRPAGGRRFRLPTCSCWADVPLLSRPQRTPDSTCRCPSRRDARMRRRSRPTWSPSPCSSRRQTGSATTSERDTRCRPSIC